MDWTKDKPTEAGWYWYDYSAWAVGEPPIVLEVRISPKDEPFVVDGLRGIFASQYPGYWLGPLEPPTPPQEAQA